MKRLRSCSVVTAALLAGCAHHAEYSDPLAGFNLANPAFQNVTAAVVVSENTKKSEQFFRKGGGPWGGGSTDVVDRFVAVFKKQFKAAVRIDKPSEARAIHADLIAILDVRGAIEWGFHVESAATLMTPDQAPIDTVRGEFHKKGGLGMGIPEVAERAARALEAALISSEKLREFAAAASGGRPAAVAATPALSPQLSPSFSANDRLEDYAVIVGIERYADLPAATYAERDAAAVKSFIRALGVPERNIILLTGSRATKNGFEKTIEGWLPNNVSEKSRVYFYYSGHGAPDTKTGDAYLVPLDGDPQYLAQTGYPLKRLYSKLGQLRAKSVLVALDSCFSGAGGRSVLAKGTRPLIVKADMAVQAKGTVSVISASAGDQISGANDEAGYGLFTYNFLQGLNGTAKDAQGQVTLKSLYGYLKPRVQDEARRGNRDQTPQLQSGAEDFVLRAK